MVTEIAVFRAAYRNTTELVQRILKDREKEGSLCKYEEVQLLMQSRWISSHTALSLGVMLRKMA